MLKFKKLAGMIGAGVMAAGLLGTVPAMAATNNASDVASDKTVVQYTVSATDFIWGVPATQVFTDEAMELTGNVLISPASPATKILTPAASEISITMTKSANGFNLWTLDGSGYGTDHRVGDSAIAYDLKFNSNSNAITDGTEVLDYISGTDAREGVEDTLKFATTAEKIAAATSSGLHADQLTFTMSTTGM